MNTRNLAARLTARYIPLLLLGALSIPVASYAVDSSTDTTGEYFDDATITLKVKARLAEDAMVRGRGISVRTDHGVVDLTGAVFSSAESDHATVLATGVSAVKAVHNNLQVRP